MRNGSGAFSWRAIITAVLLLVTGGVLGILLDRLWQSPRETHAAPLTAEAMVSRLGLSSDDEMHLRALLDSLHSEIVAVVQRNPDSLGTAVSNAQLRIEAALPDRARAGFRAWIRERHEQLMGGLYNGRFEHERSHGRGR